MPRVMERAPLPSSPRRRDGAFGRFKALAARQVASGGEKGWWRWLVPGLVVAVVLLTAVDARRSSERAASAVEVASAAEDLSGAAERASALHGSLPRRHPVPQGLRRAQ